MNNLLQALFHRRGNGWFSNVNKQEESEIYFEPQKKNHFMSNNSIQQILPVFENFKKAMQANQNDQANALLNQLKVWGFVHFFESEQAHFCKQEIDDFITKFPSCRYYSSIKN